MDIKATVANHRKLKAAIHELLEAINASCDGYSYYGLDLYDKKEQLTDIVEDWLAEHNFQSVENAE